MDTLLSDKVRLLRNESGSHIRAISGLDRKAEALGIWTPEYHLLSRKERSLAVNAAYRKAHAA